MARSRSGPTPVPTAGASGSDALRRPGGHAPRRSDARVRAARAAVAVAIVAASAAVSYVIAEQLGVVVTVERRGAPVTPVPHGSGSVDAASGVVGTGESAGAEAAPGSGALTEPPALPPGTPDGARAGAQTLGRWLGLATADLSSPDSVTVIVNKQRPLDPGHEPSDLVPVAGSQVRLRAEAADALKSLRAAAAEADVPIAVHSAYRSYGEQAQTFEGWVAALGEDRAVARSARAGHSEHQTGLAVDVVAMTGACRTIGCFGETPQAAWLAEHAHEHGWVVRYQEGAEAVTGYDAEPWHLRYVGVDVARAAIESGATSLETLFGLPAAPGY